MLWESGRGTYFKLEQNLTNVFSEIENPKTKLKLDENVGLNIMFSSK